MRVYNVVEYYIYGKREKRHDSFMNNSVKNQRGRWSTIAAKLCLFLDQFYTIPLNQCVERLEISDMYMIFYQNWPLCSSELPYLALSIGQWPF